MADAVVHLDSRRHRGPLDPRMFGGFLEHMGRAVHGGVFDPGSPRADERGFRTDVGEALRALKMPVVRYPGGNYVSAHDWRDGIGPKASRPRRPDFAWRSIENNLFGLDEFVEWCSWVGTSPMLAVNLGTGTPKDAAEMVEYVNLPRGTSWADRRPGDEPYGVKLWCLGNEMDGPWQAGHVPAEEYARRAQQASKLMKGLDPSIETVVCGSSGRGMSTYLEWDRQVLEYCWDDVDYISLHRYSENRRGDSAWFLAEGVEIERIIEDYRSLVGYVRGKKRSEKRVGLSFDEWNVWYKAMGMDGGWTEAPRLIEEVYDLEDALVCAQYLLAFLRNADVLKIGCLAQLVNVIGPLLTERDGMLLQTIYHTIRMVSATAAGTALTPAVESATYAAGERGEVPTLDVAACVEDGILRVYVVNRGETAATVDVRWEGASVEPVSGELFSGEGNPSNTWEAPETVTPQALAGRELPGRSFARLEFRVG